MLTPEEVIESLTESEKEAIMSFPDSGRLGVYPGNFRELHRLWWNNIIACLPNGVFLTRYLGMTVRKMLLQQKSEHEDTS